MTSHLSWNQNIKKPLWNQSHETNLFSYGFFYLFSKGAILHSHLLLCTKSGNLQTHLVSLPSSTQVIAWLEYWWAPRRVSIKQLSFSPLNFPLWLLHLSSSFSLSRTVPIGLTSSWDPDSEGWGNGSRGMLHWIRSWTGWITDAQRRA